LPAPAGLEEKSVKNILLIESKSPDFNIYSMFRIPRMGLALIGTAARQAGYHVRVIYQEAVPLRHEHLQWADLVGISIITSTAPEGYRLARMARAVSRSQGRETPIVFGGVHATFQPEEALAEGDYVLRGEADQTFVPFLDALFGRPEGNAEAEGFRQAVPQSGTARMPDVRLEGVCIPAGGSAWVEAEPCVCVPTEGREMATGRPGGADRKALARIPGLSWKEGGVAVHNPLPAEKVDLDSVPTPDWSIFEGFSSRIGIAMTSRGCPYDCSFCSVTAMLGRKYRMRSVDRIMADLAAVRQKHVFFYDDNFAAHPARTKELLRRIIAERGRTHQVAHFSTQVRPDVARDPELLDLMREAGFITLYLGFESVNPDTLKLYRKQQTLEEIGQAIREIHRRRIEIHGMFVFGSDADAEETFWATVRFARRHRIETVQFLILTPLPGSRQYRELEAEGRILCQEWNRYDAHNAVFLPRHMSPYRLQIGTIRAMQRFYSPAGALPWLLRGNFWIVALRAYGWRTVRRWVRSNRRRLELLRRDGAEIFVPELMRASCPAGGRGGKGAGAEPRPAPTG
jgi:radical SAM superfamily enzyme YgiQ (UPF0313 family)